MAGHGPGELVVIQGQKSQVGEGAEVADRNCNGKVSAGDVIPAKMASEVQTCSGTYCTNGQSVPDFRWCSEPAIFEPAFLAQLITDDASGTIYGSKLLALLMPHAHMATGTQV